MLILICFVIGLLIAAFILNGGEVAEVANVCSDRNIESLAQEELELDLALGNITEQDYQELKK